MQKAIRNAVADLGAGLRRWRVWVALASEDVGDQHKRTTLGPFWLLLNYLAFAGTFIFIFHRGEAQAPGYPIYVATGLLVWFFMMEVITSSSTLFVREEAFIKGTTLPLSVYVMRAALQAAIRAGYALPGCCILLALSGAAPNPMWLWSILGLAIVLAATPAVIIVFAFIGVFVPDSQYIISNVMRVGMFVTPVFWTPDPQMGGLRGALYDYNPFTHFLEIVRTPIIGGTVPIGSFVLSLVLTMAIWAVGLLLLGTFRRRVALLI